LNSARITGVGSSLFPCPLSFSRHSSSHPPRLLRQGHRTLNLATRHHETKDPPITPPTSCFGTSSPADAGPQNCYIAAH
jgi:hypothetical protein